MMDLMSYLLGLVTIPAVLGAIKLYQIFKPLFIDDKGKTKQ